MITAIEERNEEESAKSELDFLVRNQREDQSTIIKDINSLKGRKSNIDRRQIEIRRHLCTELSLEETSLPFIA
jgi:uncharacterized protein YPO0396